MTEQDKKEMLNGLADLQTSLFQFHVEFRDRYPDDNFVFLFKQMDEALQDMLGYVES